MPSKIMSACLKSILERCRSNPSLAFIPGSHTRERVLQRAAAICSFKEKGPLCLCTTDKTLVAAALLAAAHNGPRLVLPYAFSRQALLNARASTQFNSILADTPELAIAGAELITPDMLTADSSLPDGLCAPDKPIVELFTGGSTGKPQVWSKTLRNLFGEAGLLAEAFNIASGDIIASTVPPQHIYGLLFSALIPLVAHCSVLEPTYAFPQEILHAMQEQRATVLVSVPVHYHVLMASSLRRHALRLAFSSAGILSDRAADFFYNATGIAVTEIFGSTETGGIAWRRSMTDSPSWQPFRNTALRIVHQRLQVRSDFLCPGLPLDSEGFFTTADRADPSPGDSFTLHGRCDDIVKVGGKRVDLADVCDKIRGIAGVTDAYVFCMPTPNGRGSDILALVTGTLETAELRLRLSGICEPHACPRHIKIVETIPTHTTGKYDRESIEAFFRY